MCDKKETKRGTIPICQRIRSFLNYGQNFTLFPQQVKKIFINPTRAMSIESSIEARIRDAISRGEFDNLPGKGKRLDLDAYFATPEDMRMAFEMLKSNEFVPEEVEMLKEIARLKNALRECHDDEQKRRIAADLQVKQLSLAVALEKYKRKR